MASLVTLVDGTIPLAAHFNGNFQALNNETRPVTTGGTGLSTIAAGELLYGSAANVMARLGAGLATQVLRGGSVPSWVALSSTLLAVSDAEATTTSASITTLKTISSLSVPSTSALLVLFGFRKNNAAADSMLMDVRVNGTTNVAEATVLASTASNEAGLSVLFIGPRATNYAQAIVWLIASAAGAGTGLIRGATISLATTITSIDLRGRNTGGVITVGAANVRVFELLGV
jgi:hypothetical protein